MANWTSIADATLEPGKPIRAIDARALRDNPIAIAEGASGAPKIAGQQGPAIETGGITDANVTAAKLATGNNERDWVLARTAGAAAGAVGTYALLRASSPRNPDATLAGSSLTYAGALNSVSANAGSLSGTAISLRSFSFSAGSSTALSGTWRCMGRISTSATSSSGNPDAGTDSRSAFASTLWLRIS
jgi:hypothetical protein